MHPVGESPSKVATCPLATDPASCFARYQDSHLQKRNRHSWESIGECHGCRFARKNAVIAHVPEPDDERKPTFVYGTFRIDPNDFLEQPPKPKGRKPKMTCSKGHRYSTHGVLRKDGRMRCRICDSARIRKKYREKKAA